MQVIKYDGVIANTLNWIIYCTVVKNPIKILSAITGTLNRVINSVIYEIFLQYFDIYIGRRWACVVVATKPGAASLNQLSQSPNTNEDWLQLLLDSVTREPFKQLSTESMTWDGPLPESCPREAVEAILISKSSRYPIIGHVPLMLDRHRLPHAS